MMSLANQHHREFGAICKKALLTSITQRANLVLGLGFRRLKWASQDCQLDILQLLRHLWMTHVLVHNNAIHQLCILQLATNFAINLHTDISWSLRLASPACATVDLKHT